MPPSQTDGYIMLKPREEWPDPARAEVRTGRGDRAGRQRDSGQQLRILAADPAALQRADLRRAQRRRHQDLRRRPRHAPGRGEAGAGGDPRHPGRHGRQDRAGRGPADADRQARPAGAVALRAQRRRRAERRRDRDRRQERRQAVRGRPALRHRRAPAGTACAGDLEAIRAIPIPLPPAEEGERRA